MARVAAGDATGRKKVELAAQAAEELAAREKEISLTNATKAEVNETGVHDPVTGREIDPVTGEPIPEPEVEAAPPAEVVDDVTDLTDSTPEPAAVVEVADFGVEVAEDPFVTIRMNTTLEQVTIGAGNHYPLLEEGKQYRLPRAHADYLDGMGVVWGGTYRSR